MSNKNKPLKYRSFDDFTIDSQKKQIEACFRRGMINDDMPKSMVEARKKHEDNAKALKTTLEVFSDYNQKGCTVNKLKDRLEQETLWFDFYTTCVAEHKRGRDRITTVLKSVDFKVHVDIAVSERSQALEGDVKAYAKAQNPKREDREPMEAKSFEREPKRRRRNGRWLFFPLGQW